MQQSLRLGFPVFSKAQLEEFASQEKAKLLVFVIDATPQPASHIGQKLQEVQRSLNEVFGRIAHDPYSADVTLAIITFDGSRCLSSGLIDVANRRQVHGHRTQPVLFSGVGSAAPPNKQGTLADALFRARALSKSFARDNAAFTRSRTVFVVGPDDRVSDPEGSQPQLVHECQALKRSGIDVNPIVTDARLTKELVSAASRALGMDLSSDRAESVSPSVGF